MSEINKQIGARIMQLRIAKEINQENLAEFLGVPVEILDLYEKGEVSIPANILWQIASGMNLDIADFFPKVQNNIKS